MFHFLLLLFNTVLLHNKELRTTKYRGEPLQQGDAATVTTPRNT